MWLTLPVAAENGVLDTSDMYGKATVGFGYDDSGKWGPTVLKDGTIVRFTTYVNYDEIKSFDERNLSQC